MTRQGLWTMRCFHWWRKATKVTWKPWINDLDVPSALAVVFDLIGEGNRLLDRKNLGSGAIHSLLDFMKGDFDGLFGVIHPEDASALSESQAKLLGERSIARTSKDWKKSDELRKELLTLGVEVQDTPEGQKWRRVSGPA